jgi:endopolyphosphatase
LRYGDLALRYQDTIVGHLFGHMNIDHFFFIDVDELEATSTANAKSEGKSQRKSKSKSSVATEGSAQVNGSIDLLLGAPLRHGSLLEESGRMQVMRKSGNQGLVDELKKDFGEMPGPARLKLKDYVVVNVGASVIPTYLPGVRIYT